VTLTFDLVTWELIGVTCQSWSMYLWSLMILGVSFLELSSGNHFTVSSHRDLDLWPTDLKINRGHLQVMINVPMKFHDPKRKRKTCMPPIWAVSCSGSHCVNTFLVTVTLTFDLVTWKSIGVICEKWSMYILSFMILGVRVLELSSGNHFTGSSHRDLDLWPSDLKINRGHQWVMINVPMKFHDPTRKPSWVIIRKPFYCVESPWPWLLT